MAERGWWSSWFGAGRATGPKAPSPGGVGRAMLLKRGFIAELRFDEGTGQSRMLRFAPDRLLVPYTRTMLAALLLVPAPARIGMVGLGGGSQVKFLQRHLPKACIEVFENDADVLALRRTFRVPDDGPTLAVHHADAATLLPQRVAAYDLLLVDGYDAGGIPAVLSTQRFYNDCRASLRPGGAMASNWYDTDHAAHAHRLGIAFGAGHMAVLQESEQSNRVAFGWVPPAGRARNELALSRKGQRALSTEFARLRERLGGADA